MTHAKKLGVFISSTFVDLREIRQGLILDILDAGQIPMGMEFFKPGMPKLHAIETGIAESDVYLLILGSRYGDLVEGMEISYVEYEYQFALQNKKHIIPIELAPSYYHKQLSDRAISAFEAESGAKRAKNKALKERVGQVYTIRRVEDKAQLVRALGAGLDELSRSLELGGWTHSRGGTLTWGDYLSLIERLYGKLREPASNGGYHPNLILGVNTGGALTAGLLSKEYGQNVAILSLYSNPDTDIADFETMDRPFKNRSVLKAVVHRSTANILLVDSILRGDGGSIEAAYQLVASQFPDARVKKAVLVCQSGMAGRVDYYVEQTETKGIKFPYHNIGTR